ncbi:hypothetical protein GGI15_002991 [Coemansia interrupta]|uniref:Uncharacterized protein n=1 Tax=Coemansia interrupta TaxID=1126814 RepID=A0A9W8HF50_9FUNG|nr:hypothetical protein GGI15_002991 [Coemansia interrupta]
MSRLVGIGICAIGISLLHAFGTRDIISRISSLYSKTLSTENRPAVQTKQRKARSGGKRKARAAGKRKGDVALSRLINTSLTKQLNNAITHVLGGQTTRKKQHKSKDETNLEDWIPGRPDNVWSKVNGIRSRQQRQTEYSYSDIRNAFEICQQNTRGSGKYPTASPGADMQKQGYLGTISCLRQEIEDLRTDQSRLWFLHSIV